MEHHDEVRLLLRLLQHGRSLYPALLRHVLIPCADRATKLDGAAQRLHQSAWDAERDWDPIVRDRLRDRHETLRGAYAIEASDGAKLRDLRNEPTLEIFRI